MQSSLVLSILASLIVIVIGQGYLSTCARMDIPGLDKAARALCIASCSLQNCGTGYCELREGRKTCVCSRCKDGGNVPLDKLIGIASKF